VLTEISTVSDSEKRLIVSSMRKLLKQFSFPVDVGVKPSDSPASYETRRHVPR